MKSINCPRRKFISDRMFLFIFSFLFFSFSSFSQVSINSYDTRTGTASTVHSLTGVPSGALLVLSTTGELHSSTYCNVSSSPSLTWTKRADAEANNSGDAEIWTAVFTAGGSITVTSDWPGAGNQVSVCYVITNQESTLGGASASGTAQSAPSVNITTTRANSIIIGAVSDWNAINGSSRTLRDAATETFYHRVSGAFTSYSFYKSAASIGNYTEGLSAPTGQSAGTVLYEIRGTTGGGGGPDTTDPSAFTLSTTDQGYTTVDLSWTAATDNVGVTGYDIYLNGVYHDNTTSLTYQLSGLDTCTEYSIYVVALDAATNSTNSNTITPTTDCVSSSCVEIVTQNTANGTGSSVHSLTSVPAGALLVLATTCELHSTNNAGVSSSPSLTWTKRSDAEGTNSGDAEIWTAVFTAGGNITVTSDWPGSGKEASVCYVITGYDAGLSGASANASGQSAPSVNITTTKANSLIIGATSDWNAINGSSRTYRDAAIETQYHRVTSGFTSYGYYKEASSIGSYTEGLSAPTGQSAGTVLYEIRCGVVVDTVAPTAPVICIKSRTATTITIDDLTPATDNVGVTGYTAYYGVGPSSVNFGSFPYTITGLTADEQYSVYVNARDAANNLSSASNTDTKSTLATNVLFDEGFENCDPWGNWSTGQDAGKAWSRQQSSTQANEGTYSFRAEVRSGCDGYVSSGYRSEIRPIDITDSGTMWYGMSVYFDTPQAFGLWTGSEHGHFLQWHPGNGTGSATISLDGTNGLWDVHRNPSGGGGSTSQGTKYGGGSLDSITANEWHHLVFQVKWSKTGNGFIKFWLNGNLYYESASNLDFSGSWDGPDGPYLKLGMNRWGSCSSSGCTSGNGAPCDTWIIYYDNLRIGNENASYEDVAPETSGGRFQNPVVRPVTHNAPVNYSLRQNYPNPFSRQTTIMFSLGKKENINLSLFDINGRLVKVLASGSRNEGTHQVNFDAGSLAKGIYTYKLKAGEFVEERKLVIQ